MTIFPAQRLRNVIVQEKKNSERDILKVFKVKAMKDHLWLFLAIVFLQWSLLVPPVDVKNIPRYRTQDAIMAKK